MSDNKENQTVDNTEVQQEETIVEVTNKKSCPYRGFLCKAGLYSILAFFCIGEIALLVLIFGLFLSFYVAIIIAGGLGIASIAIIKAVKKYKAKKNSTVEESSDKDTNTKEEPSQTVETENNSEK